MGLCVVYEKEDLLLTFRTESDKSDKAADKDTSDKDTENADNSNTGNNDGDVQDSADKR